MFTSTATAAAATATTRTSRASMFIKGNKKFITPQCAHRRKKSVSLMSTTTTTTTSIAVIGANGKTGKRCVKYAAENGYEVIAATRSGDFPYLTEIKEEYRKNVRVKKCSINTSTMAEISNAIDGCYACIFAASSSKDGGTPQEIDRDGCVRVARACLSSQTVKRYVVVTSGAVSKPYSPVYIFLNLFGGIMRAKIEGEDAVRALYYERDDDFYTIVRPGGLTEEPIRGVAAVELNQGDDTSGRVSREDVAAVCIECLKSDAAKNATFEMYYRDTGKPMQEVFASNAKKETDGERAMGPKGRRGMNWDELFTGLEPDEPGIAQKGVGFSL